MNRFTPCLRRNILLRTWCVLGMLALTTVACAASPQVRFDTSYSVECRDVTPPEFAARYPTSRIVEAQFRISTWMASGREADLHELLIEIRSPDQSLPVVDFMPRTELDTDIAGTIEVVQCDERTKTHSAGLGGMVGVEYGIVKAQLAPTAAKGTTAQSSFKETYNRIPPKHLLLASGTSNRGYGVFFKLKPSPHAVLEGVREYAVLFLVADDWRGQALEIVCTARAAKKGYFSSSAENCGSGLFHVGLFREGDRLARAAAEELARAQGRAGADRDRNGAWTALKPLNQAVHASRQLFVGEHAEETVAAPTPRGKEGSAHVNHRSTRSFDRVVDRLEAEEQE